MFYSKKIFNYDNQRDFIEVIAQECLYRINNNQNKSFLWIVNDIDNVRAVKKYFLDLFPNKILPYFPVYTINNFINRIAENRYDIPPPVGKYMIVSIIDQIISESKDLTVLNKYQDKHFVGLLDYIYSFRNYVYSDNLSFDRDETALGIDKNLWNDFVIIEQKLQNKLNELNIIDKTTRDLKILNLLNDSLLREMFPELDWIIFEPNFNIDKISLKIMSKICDCFNNISFRIPINGNSKVYDAYKKIQKEFYIQDWEIIKFDKIDNNNLNKYLSENLFKEECIFDEIVSTQINNRVRIFSCHNEITEVELIASLIKEKISMTNNEQVRDIYITSPDLHTYLPIIEEIFKISGIPITYEINMPLKNSPLIKCFLNILDCITNNYHKNYLQKIFDYQFVKKGLNKNNKAVQRRIEDLNIKDWENFEISRDVIENISLSIRNQENRNKWIEGLKILIDKLENENKNKLSDKNYDEDLEDFESQQNKINIYKCVLIYLEQMFEIMQQFEKRMTPQEFKDAINKLFSFLNYPNIDLSFLSNNEYLENSSSINYSEKFIIIEKLVKAYNYLTKIIEQTVYINSCIRNSSEMLSIYYNLLDAQINDTSFRLTHKTNGGIRLIPFSKRLNYEIKYLIVLGCHFEAFPKIKKDNPFLYFGEVDSDKNLNFCSEQLNNDRNIFYNLLSHPKEKILFTFSQRISNEEKLPSPFIEELQTIFNIKIIEQRNIKHNKPYNYSSFLKGLSKEIFADFAKFDFKKIKYLPKNNLQILNSAIKLNKIEILRNSKNEISEYNGIINDEVLRNKIHHKYLNHYFTVRDIELYAGCPFRFFIEKILGIKIPEKIEDELTPLERGNLIHNVIYQYYYELRNKSLNNRNKLDILRNNEFINLKPTENDIQNNIKLITDIAKRELDKLNYSGLFWDKMKKNYLSIQSKDNSSGTFELFVLEEFNDKNQLYPILFEVVFGYKKEYQNEDVISDRSPINLDNQKPTIQISGRIDRIDRSIDGKFVVVDYKTGESSSPKEIESGESYQLPLYIIAAENLLQNYLKTNYQLCLGGYYYKVSPDKREIGKEHYLIDRVLKDNKIINYREQMGFLPSKQINIGFNEFLNKVKKNVRLLINELRNGIFPPVKPDISNFDDGLKFLLDNKPNSCEYCDFENICRRN